MLDQLEKTHAAQAALKKKGAPVVKKVRRRRVGLRQPRRANYTSGDIQRALDMKFDTGLIIS